MQSSGRRTLPTIAGAVLVTDPIATDNASDAFQTLCAYARNYIEEYGDKPEVDELERIIASLSRRLALDV